MKLFIWVQHLFGLGHARRMARVAAACAAEGFAVTVAAGGPGGREVFAGLPGVAAHQLPPLRTRDHQYTGLLTSAGESPDAAYWAKRQEILKLLLSESRPDILLTELFPFGRRKFADEVLNLIGAARALRTPPLVACSVRDVVEPKADPRKTAEMANWLKTCFDAVLVHGIEEILPLTASAPFAAEAGIALRYTGYVAPRPLAPPIKAGVVVSAGSGPSGEKLLAVAAEAARDHALAARPWHIFVPRNVTPPRSASPHIVVHPFTDEFVDRLAGAEVSVSEAGYNTAAEALALKTRPVLIPYDEAGQTEQPARARAFARAGFAVHLPARGLAPGALLSAVEAARALPGPPAGALSGAGRTALILKDLRGQAEGS